MYLQDVRSAKPDATRRAYYSRPMVIPDNMFDDPFGFHAKEPGWFWAILDLAQSFAWVFGVGEMTMIMLEGFFFVEFPRASLI